MTRAYGLSSRSRRIANGAVQFTLIAWGEKHVDSGVAAIATVTVPIFVALLLIRLLARAAGGRSPGRSPWSSPPSRTAGSGKIPRRPQHA
jgi:hypothetical protein